jgi:hypothetical protein
MKWTRTIPTVEGYYFKRHNGETMTIRYVYNLGGDVGWRVSDNSREYGISLKLFKPELTEWAGPIPEPE